MPTAEFLGEKDQHLGNERRVWVELWCLLAAKVGKEVCDSPMCRFWGEKKKNATKTNQPPPINKQKPKQNKKNLLKKKRTVVCDQLCVTQQAILLAGSYCSSHLLEGLSPFLQVSESK